MKNKILWSILCLLCLTGCNVSETESEPDSDSTFSTSLPYDTLHFRSQTLDKVMSCLVIKPSSYDTEAKDYPVLYLLHGHDGKYSDWSKYYPIIQSEANSASCLIVCPDGQNSWYIDSPAIESSKYETFFIDDLIQVIDSRYKTIKSREGRALSGISMGGYGSLFLAIRHKELFATATSVAGVTDFRYNPANWNLTELMGPIENAPELWAEYSIIAQSEKLQSGELNLMLDCGTEDFAFELNKELHEYWQECGIDHTYIIRPGNHDYDYWVESFPYVMQYCSEKYLRCYE